MSVEIYLQWFPDEQTAGLPTDDVLEIMSPNGGADEHGFYPLAYDDLNSCDFSMTVENGVVVALTVVRPCDDDQLYVALFNLLQNGIAVAYAPGSPPVVAHMSVANLLPGSMKETLGAVVKANNAMELRDALFAA